MATADQEITASGLPPSALPLKEAFRLFASPDRVAKERRLKEERQKYPARIRYRSRYIHGPKVDLDNQRAHRADQLEQALRANSRAAQRDLIDQLRDGRLVGYARASAFDEWKCVPPDAWDDLKVDFRKSSAEDQDGKVYTVRIDKPVPVDEETARESSHSSSDYIVTEPPQEGASHDGPIELALDHERREVIVSGVGVLKRGDYKLLNALKHFSPPDQLLEGTSVENRPFTSAYDLAEPMKVQEGSVRDRVRRCRKELARICPARFAGEQNKNRLIESDRRRGYRLAWAVRIIAVSEAKRR